MKMATKKITLQPLDVKCGMTDCPNGLHCYRPNRRLSKMKQRPAGVCWACGDNQIDWNRIQSLNSNDRAFLVRMLKTELIRHVYWQSEIDTKAVAHARRKGFAGLRALVRTRLDKYLKNKSDWDGRQTPKTGNAICCAQHATACCCRRCMEYWYAIPVDRPLSVDELVFFEDLCMDFINERLPYLTKNGEKVADSRGVLR